MHRRVNIIHVSPSYKPAYVYGGPTMSVSELCEQVQRFSANISVSVLTTTANGETELPVIPGNRMNIEGILVTYFKRITRDHSHFSPTLIKSLYRCLTRRPEQSLVHIHAWWNLSSILGCAIAIIKDTPVLLTPRGTLSSYSFNNRTSLTKKAFHLLIGKILLRKCHFHVTSEKEKQDILRLVNPRSITVIPNFVRFPKNDFDIQQSRFEDFTAHRGAQHSAPPVHLAVSSAPVRLIFLSRIEEKKGLDVLLKALSIYKHPWTLSIVGEGKPEYVQGLKAIARELRIHNNVNWVGHLGNDEKFSVLESHDLLVLPSYDENFANVVIESIAMGTPVLISHKVGLADYVQEHNLGIICGHDPVSIRDSLNKFIHSGTQFNRQHLKDRITRDFNESRLARKYIKLYKSLI